MRRIVFTEFLRPNGRQRDVLIDRPDDIAAAADELHGKGCLLTVENLGNGNSCVTCEYEGADLWTELVPSGNDDKINAAVDRVICTSHSRIFGKRDLTEIGD